MKRLLILVLITLLLTGCMVWVNGTPYDVQVGVVSTAVPLPSATTTAIPTVTPTATATATSTPIPPTPTPEVTMLPTVVYTPVAKTCQVKAAQVINVRAGAGTSYATVPPALAVNEVITIRWVLQSGDYLWAYHTRGWSVIRSGSAWWVYGTLQSEICVDVPGWPSGLEPPAAVVWTPPAQRGGVHLLFSARSEPVLAALQRGVIGNIKGTDGSETILRVARQLQPEVLLVWRNLSRIVYGQRDCPPNWGEGDPANTAVQWWSAEYATWQQRGLLDLVDFFEYRNECRYVGAWEITFDLTMLDLATRAGVCLAVFSDGYGNPQLAEFVERRPVLDYMLAHECRPGRRHLIAVHSYEGADSGPWLFGRWRLFRAALGSRYDALLWYISEYGYSDGRGAADCARFTRDWDQAQAGYAGREEIAGFAAYSVGGGTEWVDLDSCLAELP